MTVYAERTPGDREERKAAWDAWVASETKRHEGKDHEFEPDRDFAEDDVEAHGLCRGCH